MYEKSTKNYGDSSDYFMDISGRNISYCGVLGLLPLIAYNRPQNFVGCLLLFAAIFTMIRIFLNLFVGKDNEKD